LKKITWITIILALVGSFIIYLETEFQLKNGVIGGLGLIGISGSLWGIENIFKQSGFFSSIDQESSQTVTYRGFAAIMSGLTLVLSGVALIAVSVLGFAGLSSFALSVIKGRPGILLIFLGRLGSAFSLQQIIGSEEAKNTVWTMISSIPGRFFGLILLLISVVLVLAGVLEVFFPETFQHLYQIILSQLKPPDFL